MNQIWYSTSDTDNTNNTNNTKNELDCWFKTIYITVNIGK